MKKEASTRGTAASVSMHERILRDVEHKIASGIWPPGYQIPYEVDLAAEYGVSRMTMNKVMSSLSSRGLIVRRRRAGTFVSAPQIEQSVLEIRDFEREAAQIGVPYRYELRKMSTSRASNGTGATSRRGFLAGKHTLVLQGLHHIDNVPVALEDRVINLDAVPQAREQDFEATAPGSWLLKQVPWSEAEHVIRAVPADAETAKLLRIQKGAACLALERYTWLGGSPITEVQLIHPGDRYHFVGRFQPMATTSGVRPKSDTARKSRLARNGGAVR